MRAVIAALILACVPAPAFAQFTVIPPFEPGAVTPRISPRDYSFGALEAEPTGDWARCSNYARRFTHEEVLLGCEGLLSAEPDAPDRALVHYWRAIAYRQAGDEVGAASAFDVALQAYADWIAEDRYQAEPYFQRAGMLIYLQRYDAALADYTYIDGLLPRQPRTHGGLGRLAFARGDYLAAMREYDRAQTLAERRVAGDDYSIGRCESRAAAHIELELALSICNRIVRNTEGNPEALVARGFLKFIRGDLDSARADFARALERNEHLASARYGHGVVLVHLGRVEEGDADIARARTLASERVRALEAAGLR
ncbi:MAG: tetratricopeptide repeat protein [Caulobacterales bacterium]|nr:tetratricopeptide repeat protein [Caulobacterales bacterium]